ncbi:Structural maintenance of chromosomes protein 4 [Glycine max]|nr:Structural maintenance of chromosomes protein 4 [Glycine max]
MCMTNEIVKNQGQGSLLHNVNYNMEKQVDLLSKLKKNVSTPEGVPRLFDLVKVQDERMKLAFFAALRNTVVAKDLDQMLDF